MEVYKDLELVVIVETFQTVPLPLNTIGVQAAVCCPQLGGELSDTEDYQSPPVYDYDDDPPTVNINTGLANSV